MYKVYIKKLVFSISIHFSVSHFIPVLVQSVMEKKTKSVYKNGTDRCRCEAARSELQLGRSGKRGWFNNRYPDS